MRLEGVEPPRPCGHGDLNAARLPVPPQPRDRECSGTGPARRVCRGHAKPSAATADVRMRVGLVLGAGGIQGGAWLTARSAALASETGWDPTDADHIVGTSAGSMIASRSSPAGLPPWFMVAHSAGETIDGLTDADGNPAADADRSAGASVRARPALPRSCPGSWPLALQHAAPPAQLHPRDVVAAGRPADSSRPSR